MSTLIVGSEHLHVSFESPWLPSFIHLFIHTAITQEVGYEPSMCSSLRRQNWKIGPDLKGVTAWWKSETRAYLFSQQAFVGHLPCAKHVAGMRNPAVKTTSTIPALKVFTSCWEGPIYNRDGCRSSP